MAMILFGISALEWHRTPPGVLDAAAEEQPHAGLPDQSEHHSSQARRSNTPSFIRTIDRERNGTLVGVSPPFHIVDPSATRGRYPDIVVHSSQVKPNELELIAPGLFVTTPERTVLDLCRTNSTGAIAALMCELCGLYTTIPKTDRLDAAIDMLLKQRGEQSSQKTIRNREESKTCARLDGNSHAPTLAAFLDTDGNRCVFPKGGDAWFPCIGRDGRRTPLWKRPPLCTIESLIACAELNKGATGIQRFRRALRYVVEGSGSPAETICAILMGLNRNIGQEGLPPIQLNRRINLDELAASSLGRATCVVDILWADGPRIRPGCCVEVDGAAFHDDSKIDPSKLRGTNTDSVRRAALAQMGLDVVTVAWSQLKDLQQWDIVVNHMYKKLGLERRAFDTTSLLKRERLHGELMNADIH